MNRWLFIHFPSLLDGELKQLTQVLYQDVAQIAMTPPQGLLCEIASLVKLHGHYAEVIQRIQDRLLRWPIEHQLSMGFSPLCAQLLAQSNVGVLSEQQELARQALIKVAIQASELPPLQRQQLEDVGIATVGDLLDIPTAELGVRFGRSVLTYIAELTGELPTPKQYYQPPAYFDERLDLMAEVHSWKQILFPLKRLLQQAEAFLQSHQLSTRTLLIYAHHQQGEPTKVTINFAHSVWKYSDLLSLSQLYIERVQLPSPALLLRVRMVRTEPRETHNEALINTPLTVQQQKLASLVSRLQARLGSEKVKRLQQSDDWRPELTGQLAPWESSLMESQATAQRPMWLLPEAQQIDPSQWQLQWGPERIQSGWWDEQAIAREYFIAVDAWQRQGWIYRCQQGWYLHGWFS